MASLMPVAKQQYFIPGTAIPLVGGKLYTYAAGTSTPKTTWQDADGTVPNTNPITLDSTGSALIFWTGNYKIVLKDALGNTVYSVDGYNTDQAAALQAQIEQSTGSSMIGFIQSGADAVQRDVQDELRETFKLTQFFIAGEASIDAAFSRALTAFTRPGTLEIPQGFFNLAGKVQIRTDIPIKIRGAGMNSTLIFCTSSVSLDTMFEQVGAVSDTFEMSDLTLVGNGKAQCGYRSESVIASLFRNLGITGTTICALRTNNGYSNTFDNVKLYSNTGGGLQCTGVNNNNVNIVRSQIYANGGIGAELGNGYSINVVGCDIETNAVAGVVAYDIKLLMISGGYVERNGATGYAYTTADGSPENLTVHADIHLLSGGKTIGGSRSTCVTQAIIDGVQFTPYGTNNYPTAGLSIDSPIFATVVDGLRVTSCEVLDPTKIKQMVSFYNNNTKSAAYQCVIDGNTANTVGFLGVGNSAFSFATMHNVDTPLAQSPHNYVSQDLFDYLALSGSSGYLRRAANDYQDAPVYAVGVGDYAWGYDIDLTKHPELKGKMVWFGLWYHVDDNGASLQLTLGGNTDSDGSVTDQAMPANTFVFKSVCKQVLATDTNLYFSIRRIGAGTNPVLFCHSIVSAAGFGLNRYAFPTTKPIWRKNTAPVDGTWQAGDRVIARTPTVGQPKAQICTVTGAPGTWVSEGNL
jgi:hypothetical protein